MQTYECSKLDVLARVKDQTGQVKESSHADDAAMLMKQTEQMKESSDADHKVSAAMPTQAKEQNRLTWVLIAAIVAVVVGVAIWALLSG